MKSCPSGPLGYEIPPKRWYERHSHLAWDDCAQRLRLPVGSLDSVNRPNFAALRHQCSFQFAMPVGLEDL